MQFNGFGSATISVEDGEAPVDLVMNRNVWWGGSSSTLYKTGAGTLKWIATSGPDSGSPIQINGGTLLCDNASGTPFGNTAVRVNAGTTLGGIGSVGGTERGNVVVAGTAANPGVLAPGSIDEETGARIHGTFTVGSATQTNLVSLGASTKLVIGAGARDPATRRSGVDKLLVHGALEIGENATLDLVSSAVLAASYGWVMLLAAPVLFCWQGLFYAIGYYCGDGMPEPMRVELSIVGGVLILSSGLSILGIKDCKTVNLLPSLLVPVIFYLIKSL
jgi:hypothetical protein